jgi:hypothetical protein
MLPQPAAADRQIEARSVLGRASTLFEQKWLVELLNVNATVLTTSTPLAISSSFRAAFSGSA